MFYSPLRYPGGKNKLAKFLAILCRENKISGHYVEPYAGGSAVALYLLIEGYVKQITINDFDRSIYAFWCSIINHTNKFVRMIEECDITIENWHVQKDIQRKKDKVSLLKLGFSTFFLNRVNISGIIDAGPIGGMNQTGNYKMDCRFNKLELIKKIKLIASYKKNINIYNKDALELIDIVSIDSKVSNTIFYFDPPYYLKGQSLYYNSYKHNDHEAVSDKIKAIKNARWIVSYDNTPEIKKLYDNVRAIEYSFSHTAYKSRLGNEILFFSKSMSIDITKNPLSYGKKI